MITIENIHKSFGALEVLKGIDLHIDKGEVVSIVGPSGAGKTTLLQIIGTLDKPDAGRVVVDGIDTSKLSTRKLSDFRNQHLGFVFQFHQLLPEFTALENIMIPAYIAGVSQKEAKKRAKELLAFMGLSERASHKPNELSGSEKSVWQWPVPSSTILLSSWLMSPQAPSTPRTNKSCISSFSTSATNSVRRLSLLPTMRAWRN